MKENKMIVALGAAALSLASVMTSFANPVAIPLPEPKVISATTKAVKNRAEIEKAAKKVVEGLAELESLLAKEPTNGSDNIFIYRDGNCYSFEFTELRYERFVFRGFEYCEDDSYLLDGRIVSGKALRSELRELIMRRRFDKRWKSVPIIAYCLKVGVKKIQGDRRDSFYDYDDDF